MASFAPVVYHVTTNSPSGAPSFLDVPPPPTQPIGPGAQMTYIYSAPPNFSIADDTDLKHHQSAPITGQLRSFPPAGGLSTVVIDIGPNQTGEAGPMHRTQTLDHIIIVEGELEWTLDGGETRLVKAGEVVVQRAAMHSWTNPSKTKGARMVAISLGSAGAVDGAMEFQKIEAQ